MDLMIIASLVVFCLVMILAYRHVQRKQQKDSALRQKAVLNSNAQLIFSRVKSALPQAYVLAHVSFDALLTTKYLHTRRKYQKMVADFVVLDQDYRVIAVLALDDLNVMKRSKTAAYQDALLDAAGYRVIRYIGIPESDQLCADLKLKQSFAPDSELCTAQIVQPSPLYAERIARMRAFS